MAGPATDGLVWRDIVEGPLKLQATATTKTHAHPMPDTAQDGDVTRDSNAETTFEGDRELQRALLEQSQ